MLTRFINFLVHFVVYWYSLKVIYIYIKLEKKAAAVFSVHAHSNVLNKKAGREKAREREEPGEQLHKGKKQ